MQMNDEKLQLMRNEKIPKVLLKLGLPAMIGLLVSALYNVVDAYFVGGLGTSQMAAVSVAFPIGQIIIGLGMTFGSGAASYISRLLGENNQERAHKTASTALFTSLIIGGICIVLSLCFLEKLLTVLGATVTILPYAKTYGAIYIAGSIFNIFNVTVNHTITSEGASKLTMMAMMIGGCLNVALDPIFIYLLDFGVAGAAIATVISQAVTSLIYLWFIIGRKGVLRFNIRNFSPDKVMFAEILKIGIPGLMFQLLVSASTALTNSAASAYGDAAVAAMGVVIRILTVGSYVVFGFMRGFQPIAGFNYGAKLFDRLNEALHTVLKWATWFCSIAAVVMLLFAPAIMSAFSNDPTVIEIGSRALRINAILFVFYGFQIVYAVLFLATGRAKEGSIVSLGRQGIFFIPIILILPHILGFNGVLYTQPIADALSVLLCAVFAIKANKELKSKVKSIQCNPVLEQEV